MLKNFVAFLEGLAYFFSMITFDISYKKEDIKNTNNIILMNVVSVIKIFTAITYFYTFTLYGKYLKSLGKMSEKSDYHK